VWVGTPGHTGAPALDPTDERGWETGRWPKAQATAPILDSTNSDIEHNVTFLPKMHSGHGLTCYTTTTASSIA